MAFFKQIGKVGLDIGGFATNVVGPALETGGHAVAFAACEAANVVTQGKVGDIATKRDFFKDQMDHAAGNVEAGLARIKGANEPWFRSCPGEAGPWMQAVPDDRNLMDMFLPGTHDSAAKHGGDFAECQCWSLEEQLMAGIRCFDIRLRHEDDSLCCYHGIICQERHWDSVVDAMENYLDQNPTEVLLVRVTGNGCNHCGNHSRSFDDQVKEHFRNPHRWVCPTEWPTLGIVRGKVLLFACGLGNWSSLDTQDLWELGDHEEKLAKVLEHGQKERAPGLLHVNYVSSQGKDNMAYKTPSAMAYHVNHGVYDAVHTLKASVYMVDFPGPDLVNRLIQRNFA